MADDNVHNAVFDMYGQDDKSAISKTYETEILCTPSPGPEDYAVSGSEAREWANEVNYDYLQNLIDAVNQHPTLQYIVLSIGGNDILAGRSDGGWYKDMDLDVPGSESALFSKVADDTRYIMEEVWARARPDMKFLISSYDYPNFNISPLWCGFYACGKREDLSRDNNGNGSIDASELITDQEINNLMISIESIRIEISESDERVFFDNSIGLTQYYYGYNSTPGIVPGGSPFPENTFPYAPGGDPTYPTELDNFRLVGICGVLGLLQADPIHLDSDAFLYKAKNQFENLMFEDLRGNPSMTLWSEDQYDGYVDVIGNSATNNGIRVGDDGPFCCFGGADNDYRGILSFNTANIPDQAQVTGASIYMIRSSANDNPFEKGDRYPILDIKSNHFGTSPNIEVADGSSTADAYDIGCFVGKAEADKYAIRIDLAASALPYINIYERTQFRFSFDKADWSVEYLNFYDGGGHSARISEEETASPPLYEYTIFKVPENGEASDGEIIERGKQIEIEDGFVYQEKLVEQKVMNDGSKLETYITRRALEHAGLATYMNNHHSAPAGGYAPFMDIYYTLPALPVELGSFTATKEDMKARLKWQTYSEINSLGYELQHSIDGSNWSPISYTASSGTSNDLHSYTYLHDKPSIGINYYRLRIIDQDLTFEYSEIRHLNFDWDASSVSVHPNPFHDRIMLNTNLQHDARVQLVLSDLAGKVIFEKVVHISQGSRSYLIDALTTIASGTYLLHFNSGEQSQSFKVIKQ